MTTPSTSQAWNELMEQKFGTGFWETLEGKTIQNYIRTLEREHRAMRKAIEKAVKVIEGPNPAIVDTIWAGEAQTLVDLLLSTLKP